MLARLGSGSACRSVLGGFVEWKMGEKPCGSDSISVQVAPQSHWEDMRVLIVVASSKEKRIGSTEGMQLSHETSDFLFHRADDLVHKRLQKIRRAILDRRFAEFAELTMRDSNQLHACCLDTYPPLTYLNDTSHSVIALVHHINEQRMNPIVAYTFDAGPNAFLFVQKENLSMVCDYLRHCFNNPATPEFFKGLDFDPHGGNVNKDAENKLEELNLTGQVEFVQCTKIGEGPRVLAEAESLLNKNGEPRNIK